MVSNKDRVGGKIVFEIIGVWTCLLETLEYTSYGPDSFLSVTSLPSTLLVESLKGIMILMMILIQIVLKSKKSIKPKKSKKSKKFKKSKQSKNLNFFWKPPLSSHKRPLAPPSTGNFFDVWNGWYPPKSWNDRKSYIHLKLPLCSVILLSHLFGLIQWECWMRTDSWNLKLSVCYVQKSGNFK